MPPPRSTRPPVPTQAGPSALSIGTLVAGLAGGLAIVSIMGLIGRPLSGLSVVSSDTLLRIAFGLLVLVAFLSGFVVAVWRAPAGLPAAILAGLSATLLLWLMRTFLLEGQPYNRLIFGPLGFISVSVAATAGGGLARLLDDDRLHVRFSFGAPARVGLWAAFLWLSLEMVARFIGTAGLAPFLENVVAADMLAILIGFPAAGWIVARYGQANGIAPSDWDYRWTVSAMAFGVIAGFLVYGLMWGTALVDETIWGVPAAVPAGFAEALQDGAWVAVLMLAANGVAGPIGEELAWRGVVQTALVRAWGPVAAVVVTGVLFALKHVALDGSLNRVTTLVMLGLAFGLVRQRWGTGSSTAAHIVVNLLATSAVIATT